MRPEQMIVASGIIPYANHAARLIKMNPKEYVIKRPEDFHQNYKYVDNYYQSKHSWNSQKCKTCHQKKKYDEFKMVELEDGNTVVLVNCNCCIKRQKEMDKEMGFLDKAMANILEFIFRRKT